MPELYTPLSCDRAFPPPRPTARRRRPLRAVAVLAAAAALTAATSAIVLDLTLVATLHDPAGEHLDQADLLALVQQGQNAAAFTEAFEHGDELFEVDFNALDGVGANVGRGQRFTRVPRADLAGPGQWANHVPRRATGPNAESCVSCHNEPEDDGAGGASSNVHRDPQHSGSIGRMIQRNTPHVFAPGALQLLAEEMTVALLAQREQLAQQVRQTGQPGSIQLVAKGVSFGELRAEPGRRPGQVRFDDSRVDGVDDDLVVKPFQWKGSIATLRQFNRDAAHNELGMQAVEIAGDGQDGDGDGVRDELAIGDLTALTIYLAAQPRPVTKLELDALGQIPPLSAAEIASIQRGEVVFAQIGCAACHVPSLELDDPVFREPSPRREYRDRTFPAGQNAFAAGVRPDFPVSFDMTADQPDNVLQVNGQEVRLGSLRRRANGTGAIVGLYGDLKRHRMGQGLAESIDEVGTGASTFLTENLWGVGSTAPYLHDGRATTLTEAILEHSGEADASRAAFVALPAADRESVIAFLENLVLFKVAE